MVKRLVISVVLTLSVCGSLPASESAVVRYNRANRLFAASRYQEALPLYQDLLASPPAGVSQIDIRLRVGDIRFRLGSYAAALESYRSALPGQKQSRQPETQYWIGFCCMLLGRNAEAAQEFLKIPERYPGSGVWVGTGYYWAGRAYEREGRHEEAAACYRKAGGKGRTTQEVFALRRAEALTHGAAR